jgi:hypothetical protein
MANINTAGVTLRDDFVSIDEIGESDSGVFLYKLRFNLIEPFFSVFSVDLPAVFGLIVG